MVGRQSISHQPYGRRRADALVADCRRAAGTGHLGADPAARPGRCRNRHRRIMADAPPPPTHLLHGAGWRHAGRPVDRLSGSVIPLHQFDHPLSISARAGRPSWVADMAASRDAARRDQPTATAWRMGRAGGRGAAQHLARRLAGHHAFCGHIRRPMVVAGQSRFGDTPAFLSLGAGTCCLGAALQIPFACSTPPELAR